MHKFRVRTGDHSRKSVKAYNINVYSDTKWKFTNTLLKAFKILWKSNQSLTYQMEFVCKFQKITLQQVLQFSVIVNLLRSLDVLQQCDNINEIFLGNIELQNQFHKITRSVHVHAETNLEVICTQKNKMLVLMKSK